MFKTNTLTAHGDFFNYMISDFENDKDFMNYVYNVRVRSLFNCPVDVNEDDELVTLSTCSYEFTNFRTVIVARKVRAGESTKVDVKRHLSTRMQYGRRFITHPTAVQDLPSQTLTQLTRKVRLPGMTEITALRTKR